MLIYKDVVTGDELCSDSFPMKEIDDIAFEIEGKVITIKEGDYDIGGNPAGEGGEAAGEDEGFEVSARTVINVVEGFKLQETGYDKKSYMLQIKGYMQKIKKYLEENKPERVEPFMKSVQPFVKSILGRFDDFKFFTGENMDPEGMCVLLFYKEDGMTPYFYFFKDGLIGEKY